MKHLKNYQEFLLEEARINLDLVSAKERGEAAAEKFNQTLDIALRSILGKYDQPIGDVLGRGQEASMKIAQILIECSQKNMKLTLVIAALISTYGISKTMIRNSVDFLDNDTKQEIVQDSITADTLALPVEPPPKKQVKAGKKTVELTPLGSVTDSTAGHESNEMRGEDHYGCGHFGASRDGGTRPHNGLDLRTQDGGGETLYSPIDGYVKRTDFLVYNYDERYHGVDIIGTGQDSGVIVRLYYIDASVKVGDTVSRGTVLGQNENLQLKYQPIRDGKRGPIKSHVHVEVKHTSQSPIELINMDVETFRSNYSSADYINPAEIMPVKEPSQNKKDTPVTPVSRGNSSDFFKSLADRESSNTWDTINTLGYMGKYQMSEEAIHDVAKKSSLLKYLSEVTVEGFRKDSSIFNEFDQEKAIRVHTRLNRRYLKYAPFKNLKVPGYSKRFDVEKVDYYTHFDGQIIKSTYLNGGVKGNLTVTKSGILGGCHLCGASSVKVFLDTGGKINPKDGNGIHVSEYMDLFKNYDLSDLIKN